MSEKKWKEYLTEEIEGKRLLGMVSKDRIVKVHIKRPPKRVAEEFLKLEDVASTVSDVLDSLGYTKNVIPASVLKPINPGTGQKIAGPAITVQNVIDPTSVGLGYEKHLDFKHGADREAYQLGEPGDVVVIDGAGHDISNMGGLSATVAKAKGMGGNIVNGSVRDVELIRKTGYPVWSRGYTPITGKFRYECIALNCPVECAGVKVVPGDFIVADDSGVAVIPAAIVEKVLELAVRWTAIEDELIQAIEKRGYDIDEIMRLTTKRYVEAVHK
jgi:4-hydroxy-4-methyl-2-oxoglutarate aldolase